MVESYRAVRAVATLMLAGVVLQAEGVSAGNGKVIDWRAVKSGEEIQASGDAFDTADLFVALVGPDAALAAVESVTGEPGAEPAPGTVRTRVHAYAQDHRGARRRSFDVGPFTVMIEPHEDDAAQAAFAARLAELAASLA